MSNRQSMLEDHPLLRDDFDGTAEVAGRILSEMVTAQGFDEEEVKSALEGGATLAAVLGLEAHHTEALYTQAYDLLQVGKISEARTILTTLLQLEPTNERAVYAMGASHQLQGNMKRAAEIFMIYASLDATNPIGYLRIGECLLAAGEAQDAYEVFEIAAGEAARGNGEPGAEHQARERMAEAISAGAKPAGDAA